MEIEKYTAAKPIFNTAAPTEENVATEPADYINIMLSDGKIGNFKQGSTGNCWLLGTIKAISETPNGKDFFEEIITQNSDGSVNVKLKGTGSSYRFTQQDLYDRLFNEKATKLSEGDVDVRLLEMAIEKELKGYPKNGSTTDKAIELLLGNKTTKFYPKSQKTTNAENIPDKNRNIWELSNYIIREKPKNITITAATFDENLPQNSQLTKNHMYSVDIKNSTEETLILINPHDTKKMYLLHKKDIKDNINYFTIIDMRKSKPHSVKLGERLQKIAQKNKIDTKSLLIANPQIEDVDKIYPKEIINIPMD